MASLIKTATGDQDERRQKMTRKTLLLNLEHLGPRKITRLLEINYSLRQSHYKPKTEGTYHAVTRKNSPLKTKHPFHVFVPGKQSRLVDFF